MLARNSTQSSNPLFVAEHSPLATRYNFANKLNSTLNNIKQSFKNRPYKSPMLDLKSMASKEQVLFYNSSYLNSGFTLVEQLIFIAFKGDTPQHWQLNAMINYNAFKSLSDQTKPFAASFKPRGFKLYGDQTVWSAECLGCYLHLLSKFIGCYFYWMDSVSYDGRVVGMDAETLAHLGLKRPARWVVSEELKTTQQKLFEFSQFLDDEFDLKGIASSICHELLSVLLYRISYVKFINSSIKDDLVCLGYSQKFADAFVDIVCGQMKASYQVVPEWQAVPLMEPGGKVTLEVSYREIHMGNVFLPSTNKTTKSLIRSIHACLNARTNPLISKSRMSNKHPILFSFEEML